jgi:hypothetical protein
LSESSEKWKFYLKIEKKNKEKTKKNLRSLGGAIDKKHNFFLERKTNF